MKNRKIKELCAITAFAMFLSVNVKVEDAHVKRVVKQLSETAEIGADAFVEPIEMEHEVDVARNPEAELVTAAAPKTVTAEIDVPYYPEYKGFKSFESCENLTAYVPGALQELAYTDENGFRRINDRYMVAVGTYFSTTMGQEFDLVLENGTIIECVVSDQKDDRHTDSMNAFTVESKCCSEFAVDPHVLLPHILQSGDVSDLCPEWQSPVVKMIFYEDVIETDFGKEIETEE